MKTIDLLKTGDIVEQIDSNNNIYHSIIYIIDGAISKVGQCNICSNMIKVYGENFEDLNRFNDKIIGIYRPNRVYTTIDNFIFTNKSFKSNPNYKLIWEPKTYIEVSMREIADKFSIPVEKLRIKE